MVSTRKNWGIFHGYVSLSEGSNLSSAAIRKSYDSSPGMTFFWSTADVTLNDVKAWRIRFLLGNPLIIMIVLRLVCELYMYRVITWALNYFDLLTLPNV